jgi:hypothetical protein
MIHASSSSPIALRRWTMDGSWKLREMLNDE